MSDAAFLKCIRPACAETLDLGAAAYACPRCGALLDVAYDWNRFVTPGRLHFFRERWANRHEPLDFSGVWRFRELLPFAPPSDLVTIGEGQTLLQAPDVVSMDLPMRPGHLHLQYEGLNPSGSFKDNGMAAAFTMARRLGRTRVGCASTGNTSASLALYAALTRLPDGRPMQGIVFIGDGKIAHGKLSQALDHGATTVQIAGDFDACMNRIQEVVARLGLYLVNSVNPFRLEGQKTIIFRVLESLDWSVPDWIVVPGGNLGNASAFGKAFIELRELGLVDRIPRLAVVNAAGADTLCRLYNERGLRWKGGDWNESIADEFYREMSRQNRRAATVATAIEIGRPVNLAKALRALEAMNGVVCKVTDEEILDEKALIGRVGLGCEPASAASLAGLRQLLSGGVIPSDARVVCILTGHVLKDPDATVGYHLGREAASAIDRRAVKESSRWANAPIRVDDSLEEICKVLGETA